MGSHSFRDRFLTPQVARAITSPGGIIIAATGASAAILVGLPVVAVAGVGALAWAARVAIAVPRNPHGPRIDAARLKEPWRNFVHEAQQAQQLFARALKRVPPGPLRESLVSIADRIASGVEEVWKVAQAGNELSIARGQIDLADITRQRQHIDPNAAAIAGSPSAGTVEALDAQFAAVSRMDAVIADTADRLRLLDARLDEAVTRAVELSARAESPDEVRGLGDDVDVVVDDMESLRLGLDEVDEPPAVRPPPPAT
ncbi:MAG: hypothetical protein WCK41_00735 [Actinomycetes bacterium]